MKLRYTIIYCLLFLFILITPQKAFSLEGEDFELVNNFKNAFLKSDKHEIAKFIRFPLSRERPIPSIDTPEELVKRFEEVFDDKLSNLIKNSNIHKDWQTVGWRGIMLNNGALWIDYDGKVRTINYQSEIEKAIKNRLIKTEKKKIHNSIREFNEPVLDWKTKQFRVRIDEIGEYRYRYAAWSKDQSPLTKPNLVIDNGKRVPEGSGGNHYYEFKNRSYIYKVYVFVSGTTETPIGILEVFKKDKQLLSEKFIEAVNP